MKAPNKKRGRAKRSEKKAVEIAGSVPPATLPVPAVSDPIPPAPLGANPPSDRSELGRWIRGQSGNPKGRPKGLRNYVTTERLALEAALRSYLSSSENLPKLLTSFDRLLTIASTSADDKTAVAAIKVLADKLLTAPKDASEESSAPNQLTVVITQARGGDAPAVQIIEAVDAEFTETEEEDGD